MILDLLVAFHSLHVRFKTSFHSCHQHRNLELHLQLGACDIANVDIADPFASMQG